MSRVDPKKLHFGPYRAPRKKRGSVVMDEARGEVMIAGMTDGRIPWPTATVSGGRSLILFGSLVRAVRREAAQAVCHWWGVGPSTVNKWRRSLGVHGPTEGETKLRKAYARTAPWAKRALQGMWAKAQDPERRAKIAASKRGKKRPAHVIESLRAANKGRPLSKEHRRKLSDANRRLGIRPPWLNPAWTAEDDFLLCTLAPAEVAKRTKRTLTSVYSRRSQLGVSKVNDRRFRKSRLGMAEHIS